MNRRKMLILASCLVSGGLLMPVAAKADVQDKKTTLTTNVPIKIPNTNVVLTPGKYVIKLLEAAGTRNIVQVFNEAENKLYTTALAIPNYRLTPSNKTIFTYWETPSNEPIALRSWFYPGDTYGVEFAYSRKAANEIAQRSKHTVPTVYSDSQKPSELKTARIGGTTSEGKEAELSKDEYSVPKEGEKKQSEKK